MGRTTLLAAVLVFAGLALADEASDRIAEAQRRLAEKQTAAKVAATKPSVPLTKPASPVGPRSVVFIVDARGSIEKKMAEVRKQVLLGIGELTSEQTFGLVVLHDSKAELWKPSLLKATPANADAAAMYLQAVTAEGPTRPSAGFDLARGLRPDVAWYISTGISNLESEDEVIAAAKKSRLKINTVLHFADDSEGTKEHLRSIAASTGGICLDEHGQPVPDPKTLPPPKVVRPTGPSIFGGPK